MSTGSHVSTLVLGAAAVGGFIWLSRSKDAEARALVKTAEARTRAALTNEIETARSADLLAKEAALLGREPEPRRAPHPSSSVPPLGPDGRPSPYRFDKIFEVLGKAIPVAYLRALAQAESGLIPDDPKGLINVVSIALADYNRRHPKAPITAAQMRDPVANVVVATDILRAIIASYFENHPDVANLRENWRNPRFVELLTAGWNAGHSERGGVGRVVRFLRSRGVTDITVDRVFAAARAAGAASTLTNPAKLAFARKVTAPTFAKRS